MVLPWAVWLLCALFALAAGATPTQQYVLSLTDQSPAIFYTPAAWGDGTDTWNVSYSLSPWSSVVPSDSVIPQGTSCHWTNASNALIYFNFVGTGFTAYGRLSGGSTVDLQVDFIPFNTSVSTDSGRPTLASVSGLEYGFHQVKLTRSGSGGIEFYGADLLLAAGDNGSTLTNTTMPFTSGSREPGQGANRAVGFSGLDWGVGYPYGTTDNSSAPSIVYTHTLNASATFTPPLNTSIMIVYGGVDPVTAVYQVVLSSDVYNGNFSNKTEMQYQTYTPVTPWAENDQILFYASLEQGYSYSVSIRLTYPPPHNESAANFQLARVVYISATTNTSSSTTSTSPSSTASVGTGNGGSDNRVGIIAGSVGGAVAVIFAIALWWFCSRRRRRAQSSMYVEGDDADTSALNDVTSREDDEKFDLGVYSEQIETTVPVLLPFSISEANLRESVLFELTVGSPVDDDLPITPTGRNYDQKAAVLTYSGPAASSSQPGLSPISIKSQLRASPSSMTTSLPRSRSPLSPVDTLPRNNTNTSSFNDGLDPSDPNFERKRDILHHLDQNEAASAEEVEGSPSHTSPSRSFTREVDVGRLARAEDILPPDYNPDWRRASRS